MGIIHTYHRLWPVLIVFFLFHKGIYLMAPCLWKKGLMFWYSKASPPKNLIMQTRSWQYSIIQMASPCFERPRGSGHPLTGPKKTSMPLVIPSYFGSCWKGLAVSGTFLIGPWQNPCAWNAMSQVVTCKWWIYPNMPNLVKPQWGAVMIHVSLVWWSNYPWKSKLHKLNLFLNKPSQGIIWFMKCKAMTSFFIPTCFS
jgi:hypothetical protein